MGILSAVYHEIIYRPLFNGLVFLYGILPYPDLGLAIFVLTLVIRIVLHPMIARSVRSQAALARIQPKLADIKKRFPTDREAQARETLTLYRAEGIHPFSGCIPILVQLPILIGLYQVFWRGIANGDFSILYPMITNPGHFNPLAFGLVNLAAPSVPLALLAGASQYLQGRFMPKTSDGGEFGRAMRFQMIYGLPIVIAVISWRLPAAVAFYWTVMNALAIVQQLIIEQRIERIDGNGRGKGNSGAPPREIENIGAH